MGKHDKKDNPNEYRLIAIDILEGVISGIISGLIVYMITK